ncbi:MAG: hypothetical protein CMO30_00620 [Tistrella sp.]|jgi:hypothetical protein|nr:hypothetical protein [Tistrella sp.]MAD40301.1 hypothetical protein [Tistrella sp.]MBA73786.1 hypothetical protein [Tistrella sp.]
MTRFKSGGAADAALMGSLVRLWLEAGTVMMMRTGMSLFQTAPAGEEVRMVTEKPAAFIQAQFAATAAAGAAITRDPMDPMGAMVAAGRAWTGVISRKTSANRRRLNRHISAK